MTDPKSAPTPPPRKLRPEARRRARAAAQRLVSRVRAFRESGRENRQRRQRLRLSMAWGMGFITALSCLLSLTLWMAGTVYSRLPESADLGPQFKKVDAIVCLAGGRGRIRRALELYDRGLGDVLYISGADPAVGMKGILRELGWVGPLEDRIVIERVSTNTIENAQEVAKYLIENHKTSILLVTSIYHVRRAYFIFRRVLPRNVDIKVSWYEREPFERNDWWKSANGIWVTVGEFFKFFYAYLRLSFQGY